MSEEMTGTTTATAAPRATIMDKTVCLVMSFSMFGNRRKANIGNVETAADKLLLSLSKKLLESAELKAVAAVKHDVNHFIDSICMPSMMKTGVKLLPIPLIERVEQELTAAREKWTLAVDAFLEVYPDQVREIETRLADQYDARNYPTVEKMRTLFAFSWQYVTFGVPGSLKSIKASLFDEEKKKFELKMHEAQESYRDILRVRMLKLVEHLREQLAPTADGKKRKIYAAQVDKLTEGLGLFNLQNATDDDVLAGIVDQARAVMQGVDVDTLRDDEAFKLRIAEGLAGVAGQLNVIVSDRDDRDISFDDDEAGA